MKGDLKLIEFFEDMHIEMYDLAADPSELCDLSKSMPDKAAELLSLLHDWQASVNAQMPTVNEEY